MSLPRYASYKDSGVEWLGEVPSHWEIVQFKRLVSIQNGADYKQVERLDGYPVIGSGGPFTFASDYLYDGESVLLGRKGTVDKPLHVTGRFWTVDTMYWTKIRQGICGRYVYYAAVTIPFDYYSTNTALPSMTQGALNSYVVALAPLPEQIAIAAFLDSETAKIDALVEAQERLITLLKEKRQAVISHAVTKGLDPSAPMKDSGVEWLGQVPAHWEVKAIRHFADVLRGKFTHRPRNDPAYYDGKYPFIQTGDITASKRFVTTYRQTLNDLGASVSKEFPIGTLVMAIAANIGDVAILNFPAFFPDSIVGLVPKIGIELPFLFYLMQSMKQSMLMIATVSTQMNLNVDQIISLVAARPSIEEQAMIVEFLDDQMLKASRLEAQAEAAINLLQERRAALISAAVTGKIDVRGSVTMEEMEPLASGPSPSYSR